MSSSLLRRVREHIGGAGLLEGYRVRYYRWSDDDLRETGNVILFRMKGTSGPSAHVIQQPDVSLQMLCNPDQVESGDRRMLQILQFLRENFAIEGGMNGDAFNLFPTSGGYAGPAYLETNRACFELIIRCMVTDH